MQSTVLPDRTNQNHIQTSTPLDRLLRQYAIHQSTSHHTVHHSTGKGERVKRGRGVVIQYMKKGEGCGNSVHRENEEGSGNAWLDYHKGQVTN